MQTSNKTLSLDLLVQNPENPRLEKATGAHLLSAILSEGLLTRLLVEPHGDKYLVLQGNNRTGALTTIQATEPERFKELFPRGVPCTIVEKWESDYERATLINDQGLVKPLTTIYEAGLATRIFMRAKPSITSGELVDKLAHTLDMVFPIRQQETLLKLSAARDNGTYAKELHAVRRGVIQLLQAIALGPKLVEQYYYAVAKGEVPEVPLTREQVASLMKAHNADLAIKDETGICPFSRVNYGPNVLETIETIKVKNVIKATGAEERANLPKPLSKTELEAINKTLTSRTMKQIFSHILGLAKFDLGAIDEYLNGIDDGDEAGTDTDKPCVGWEEIEGIQAEIDKGQF